MNEVSAFSTTLGTKHIAFFVYTLARVWVTMSGQLLRLSCGWNTSVLRPIITASYLINTEPAVSRFSSSSPIVPPLSVVRVLCLVFSFSHEPQCSPLNSLSFLKYIQKFHFSRNYLRTILFCFYYYTIYLTIMKAFLTWVRFPGLMSFLLLRFLNHSNSFYCQHCYYSS